MTWNITAPNVGSVIMLGMCTLSFLGLYGSTVCTQEYFPIANTQKSFFFKEIGLPNSKYANHFRFNCQHDWGTYMTT